MKKLVFVLLSILIIYADSAFADSDQGDANQKANEILQRMTLREKIGQKLMLDFRVWCDAKPEDGKECSEDFIKMNPGVEKIISGNHIGGVILFASNLKDVPQITTLTHNFQQIMAETNNLPLLIGTDQEGGIVSRLPRNISTTFPGNMAIAAAYLGDPLKNYSNIIGRTIALNLRAVGINTDFAPDIDVNINPLNPVINVRSFSDDPELVAELGLNISEGLQSENVAASVKHFPGHGDTNVDSHAGLPLVTHTLDQAWQIDLLPFKTIIEKNSPDLVMTAHIQFPALDNSQIHLAKCGEDIITPATLSRRIQTDLLRNQLNYQGVVITDALDMGAIAQKFDPVDAAIRSFQAGVDIALMPVSVSVPGDADKVSKLIAKIEDTVKSGELSEKELNESVLRIILLKLKLGLFQADQTPLSKKIIHAQQILSDKSQHALEKEVTDKAITLVQNNNQLIPVTLKPNTKIHILTPWLEQGAGIAMEIKNLQAQEKLPADLSVSYTKMADTDLELEKIAVNNADIVIAGNSTNKMMPLTSLTHSIFVLMANEPNGSLVFPELPQGDGDNDSIKNPYLQNAISKLNEPQFAYEVLQYAKSKGKKTIFISFVAPYDLPNYRGVADAMLAGYDNYGYVNGSQGYYRGPSMPALTRIIFGLSKSAGKLPINIPNPDHPDEIIYNRGYGL